MKYDNLIANQPIVIDNGSGIIKAGMAGEETPKCVFPSFVGIPKHKRVMAGAVEGDIFVGMKAEEMRGLLRLNYALSHGIVKNWNDIEALWAHTFSELKINSEEHPALLTEAPLNPRKNREKAAEIFFDTFHTPALFVSVQAVLALYASGRTTGVVLDAGDGVCHSVPVFEGFALSHGITRSDVAGRDVTEYLSMLLRKSGHIFHSSSEMEVVRQIKESTCYVAFNPHKEDNEKDLSAVAGYPYTLPDGQSIVIGSERYRAPEILFQPSIIGSEYPGIQEVLGTSIAKSDLDLRKTLYSQIILSGGTTMFVGFGDRMLNEIRKLAPKDIKIRISAPPERKMSTWMGGSILASLSSFKKMWVSRQEYEDEGPSVLHRKSF